MKQKLQQIIVRAISQHLVQHVQTDKKGDRIEILSEQAANEILELFVNEHNPFLDLIKEVAAKNGQRLNEACMLLLISSLVESGVNSSMMKINDVVVNGKDEKSWKVEVKRTRKHKLND